MIPRDDLSFQDWEARTRHIDPRERAVAIRALARFGERGLAATKTALHDKDPSVRMAALETLPSVCPDKVETANMLADVLRDGIARVRELAAWQLYDVGPTRFVLPALRVSISDSDPQVRGCVARALGAIATDREAAVAILASALNDPDAEVRACVAMALGDLGPDARTMIDELAKLAAADEDEEVRQSAQEALHRIRSGASA